MKGRAAAAAAAAAALLAVVACVVLLPPGGEGAGGVLALQRPGEVPGEPGMLVLEREESLDDPETDGGPVAYGGPAADALQGGGGRSRRQAGESALPGMKTLVLSP